MNAVVRDPATFRLAAFVALVSLACALPRPADAAIVMNTNAASACKAAYSGSTSFRYGNMTVENIGTSDQYLVCDFAQFSIGYALPAQPLVSLQISFSAGLHPGTVSCTAQYAHWFGGSGTVFSSSTRTMTLEPGSVNGFAWTDADLQRDSHNYNLVMTCRVPRGFRLGTIQRAEREPAGGWTTD